MKRTTLLILLLALSISTSIGIAVADTPGESQTPSEPAPEPVLYTEEQLAEYHVAYRQQLLDAVDDALAHMRQQMWQAGVEQQDIITNNIAEAAFNPEAAGQMNALLDRLAEGIPVKLLPEPTPEPEPAPVQAAPPPCEWLRDELAKAVEGTSNGVRAAWAIEVLGCLQ